MTAYRDFEDVRPHTVYRIYDSADRLLWIGCTVDIGSRIEAHRSLWSAAFGSSLIRRGYARHTVQEYPDRATARDAERAAITAEGPWLNVHHNPTRWQRVNGRRVPTDTAGLRELAASILGPRPDLPFGEAAHDEFTFDLEAAS